MLEITHTDSSLCAGFSVCSCLFESFYFVHEIERDNVALQKCQLKEIERYKKHIEKKDRE